MVTRRRRLPAAERRETILDAATEVFAEAGYRAAKVSDVAARVGVTEPVVFQNFGSKAELFAAVIERAATTVRTSLDDLAEGFGSASGLLAHVLTGSLHGPDEHGPDQHGPELAGGAYGVLFADAAMMLADATLLTAEPEVAGPARAAVRAVAAHLADLIRRAQAEAGPHCSTHPHIGADPYPGTDPEAAAWLMLSVLSARRLRAAVMPAGLEPAVRALALRGLGCTPRDRWP